MTSGVVVAPRNHTVIGDRPRTGDRMTVAGGPIRCSSSVAPVEWAEGPAAIAGLAELLRDRTLDRPHRRGRLDRQRHPRLPRADVDRGPRRCSTPSSSAPHPPSSATGRAPTSAGRRMGHAHPNDGSPGPGGPGVGRTDGGRHPERRRAAQPGRQPDGGQPARRDRLGGLPGLRGPDAASRRPAAAHRAESGPGGSAAGRARRAAPRRRCGGARSGSTSSWPTARPAVDGSSPMSSSSVSRCPRTGCSSPTTWSMRARCWSCSGRR